MDSVPTWVFQQSGPQADRHDHLTAEITQEGIPRWEFH